MGLRQPDEHQSQWGNNSHERVLYKCGQDGGMLHALVWFRLLALLWHLVGSRVHQADIGMGVPYCTAVGTHPTASWAISGPQRGHEISSCRVWLLVVGCCRVQSLRGNFWGPFVLCGQAHAELCAESTQETAQLIGRG